MLISMRAVVLAAIALLASFAVAQELSPQLTQQVVDLFAGNGSVSSGATEAGLGIGATGGRHTNNWAVLVCASRYWFNYRVCRGGFRFHPQVIIPSLIIHHASLRHWHGLVATIGPSSIPPF
jgi:hypothetical protein